MSILRHDHLFLKPDDNIRETGASDHVDSSGKHFGAAEHLEFLKGIEWKEGEKITLTPLEHRHKHIEERVDEGGVKWFYRPPGTREAEREIVSVGAGKKKAPRQLGEDEEFS